MQRPMQAFRRFGLFKSDAVCCSFLCRLGSIDGLMLDWLGLWLGTQIDNVTRRSRGAFGFGAFSLYVECLCRSISKGLGIVEMALRTLLLDTRDSG